MPVPPSVPALCHTLPNGIQLWVSVNPEAPRVHARVVHRWGAADDPEGLSGAAHLVEHLMANKGTARLGSLGDPEEPALLAELMACFDALHALAPGDPAEAGLRARAEAAERALAPKVVQNELKVLWSELGGLGLFARTGPERTEYGVDLGAAHLRRWAALEADRIQGPSFRGLSTELRTICEEVARAGDDPGRASKSALAEALWAPHPYGRPVLGRVDELARPSPRRLLQHVWDRAAPDQIGLIVVGDVDPDEVLGIVSAEFGPLPARRAPPRAPRPAPAPLQGERAVEVQHHGQAAVHLGWRSVARGDPAAAAARLLDLCLSNGRTGWVDRRLVRPGRVRAGGSWRTALVDGGEQVLWANPREGQTADEAAGLLLELVDRLRTAAPAAAFPAELLAGVRENLRASALARVETNEGRAAWLSRAFVDGLDPAAAAARDAAIDAVRPEDLHAVLVQILGPDRVRVTRRPGPPPAVPRLPMDPAHRELQAAGRSAFAAAVLALPAVARPPRWVEEGRDAALRPRVDGGPALEISAPNPFSDLSAATLVWGWGRHHDPRLAPALRLLSLCGVGCLDAEALDAALHAAAAAVGHEVGRAEARLRVTAPAAALGPALDRVLARLDAPRVDGDRLHAEVSDLLRRRVEARATRAARVQAARAFALHGAESPLVTGVLSEAALRALVDDPAAPTRALRGLSADLLRVGPAAIDLPVGAVVPPPAPPLRLLRPPGARVLLLPHDGAQVAVLALRPGPPHDPAAVVEQGLLQRVLGGAAGLLFQQVRESRGIAYAVSGGYEAGSRPGDDDLLWATASTAPERAAEAAGLLAHALGDGLLALPEARVERARAGLREALSAGGAAFRAVPELILRWRRLGHRGDPRPSALAALPAADPAAFAAALPPTPVTLVLVGDLSRVDRGALAAHGPIEELRDADVFAEVEP